MTRQKSLKEHVRARMEKTGESYTAARRQVVPGESKRPATALPEKPTISSASLAQATGQDWAAWFAVLDAWEAHTHKHAEIARWLVQDRGVDGWWAQGITVEYERCTGQRALGQRMTGEFESNASKSVPVSRERLIAAFTDPAARERWLPGDLLQLNDQKAESSSISGRYLGGDGGRIALYFTAKDESRSQVALRHLGVADAEAHARLTEFWHERLGVLRELLAGAAGGSIKKLAFFKRVS
ncbi:hypothetical protein [Arthrobacter sp. H5]|uniref:hypothetical protein n=1 Tax=Arthrobacter sp. H5 TaxID=1267973 RepID=UPI0004AFDF66|nr:hypothetical protein [Arthrobacter sp. H5]